MGVSFVSAGNISPFVLKFGEMYLFVFYSVLTKPVFPGKNKYGLPDADAENIFLNRFNISMYFSMQDIQERRHVVDAHWTSALASVLIPSLFLAVHRNQLKPPRRNLLRRGHQGSSVSTFGSATLTGALP
ncbi:hypothetical protein P3W85_01260 [Cupriavidus basilensis]|uniref:Uncharacterized protein n=1 Tax=Cupriavidus basilensis TaxID=68895 RepID=A0ABT6AG64_9BURK|nr:hypothetical protein [Cupriavidus basilensis]MDF3831593.1 hypothetical protein [Cupriavidus basilensis]